MDNSLAVLILIVTGVAWRWMFNPELGIVNAVLKGSGLVRGEVYWLSDPTWAMVSTILLNVWKFTPFVVICVLARLQTIPVEIVEAAQVDGAGAWRRFLHITLPQLKAVLAVVVVFRTIWTFNKFEEIYLLTRGGPGTSTFNLAVYAFEQATANLKLGVAAATGALPGCLKASPSDEQGSDKLTPYEDVTTYNNYYEFGTGKEDPAENAGSFRTRP